MWALQSTAVPVPRTLALRQDEEVPGATFHVMAKVAGTPCRYAAELAGLGPERTRKISAGLAGTLATPPCRRSGLGRSGRLREGGRVPPRSGRALEEAAGRAVQPRSARSRRAPRRLAANIPAEPAAGSRHRARRLPAGNVLVDDQDRLAAVLDREMAALGDPLTDLALMLACDRLGSVLPGHGRC
jgi:aminoglycoside phosphotransferase (APT) family kinase protein